MANITSQLIVQLLDQVSGPAKQVGNALRGITRTVQEVARAPLDLTTRLDAAITRNNRALADARLGIADAVGGFYALKAAIGAPVSSAMELESALAGIGTKAGLSVGELAALRKELVGTSSQVNQSTRDLAGSVDQLVGIGLDPKLATSVAAIIGKATTATGAGISEMTGVAGSFMQNLKLDAQGVATGFDIAASAAKAGGFEFKDMAAYLPGLTAQYEGMGVTGTKAVGEIASMLQILRTGTGDASTAANNYSNLIQKVYSPTTVAKFKDANIDLMAALEDGAKKGLTPVEAFVEVLREATGGDATKIGNFIEDMQAGAAARLLMQKTEEYRGIRDEAMAAQGTIDGDFATMMDTTKERAKAAGIAFENLKESIGSALLPVVRQLTTALTPMIQALGRFAESNPELVAALGSAAGGFIGLKAAMAGLRFVGLMGKGGALSALSIGLRGVSAALAGFKFITMTGPLALIAGLRQLAVMPFRAVAAGVASLRTALVGLYLLGSTGGLSAVLKTIGSAILGLLSPMRIVRAAALALRVALAMSGVGLVLLGIAAAGKFIYDNWSGIKEAFEAFGTAFTAALGPVKPMLDPVISAVGSLFGWLGKLSFEISPDRWRVWGEAAGTAVGNVVRWFAELPAKIAAQVGSLYEIGRQFMTSFFDGLVSIGNDILNWASGIGDKISSMLTFSGPTPTPTVPPRGGSTVVPAPARARGGPVSRGSTYMVGEKGPELITAGRSGYVNKAGAATAGPITVSPVFNMTFNGKTEPEDVVQQIRRVLRDEVRETFRGVFSDTGMRMA